MTRVLQAMAGAEYGGAEAFFVRLALAMHKAGVEQRLIIRDNHARAETLRKGGLAPAELPFGGRFDFRTRAGFRREIHQFKPDVVLTWMNRASHFCPRGDFVHVGRLGGYYDLKYYAGCDHLIGNTQDIVDYVVRNGWSADRAHYLPNFVSEDRAPPQDRMAYYTPENSPLILALGRLHENKGFDVLLKALSQVPEAYLWIAGDGPLRAETEGLASKLGVKPRVRFLGWREDVAALFASADLFVCPSRHEPLGNVVLEAWAQGLPVVAADSLGPGTLIEQDRNGVLAPVDDPVALGKAMRRVLSNQALAERIADGGRRTFEERFTETAIVAQYKAFFERITGRCAASPES
ncbi:MAG: glycosyltransferase [Alphaproteobacteria bacterium]|nr:glycosyltransferase [Alphaproteobacteria bacterium]MBF0129715.1 glycosyltransferase [Alphaproteobacteria bacterium]